MADLYDALFATRFSGPSSAPAIAEHTALHGRELPSQHPIKAIDGLQDALDGKQPKGDYVLRTEMPETLPNPKALTFTGGASGKYDGHSALTVKIPDQEVSPSAIGMGRYICNTVAEEKEKVAELADQTLLVSAPRPGTRILLEWKLGNTAFNDIYLTVQNIRGKVKWLNAGQLGNIPQRTMQTLVWDGTDWYIEQKHSEVMIVTAIKNGDGAYKADKTSSEIINFARTGVVILRYTDNETNKTIDVLMKGITPNKEPLFYDTFKIGNNIYRTDATVDYNGNVTKKDETLVVPVMDDVNLSNRTTMSSIETVRRLAPIKTKKGMRVELHPVEGYPLDIITEINPVQAGENTPSITNERAISGWDEALITVDNTNVHSEYRQSFGRTIYGGTYEPNRGKLTITLASRLFNGSEAWEKIDRTINGRTTIFKLHVPGLGSNVETMVQMCNIFKTGPNEIEAWTSDCIWAAGDDVYIGNGIVKQFNSDVAKFKEQLGKTNLQLVYELANKKEEILEQKKILAIEGRNVLETSTGNISVSAPALSYDEADINEVIFNFLQTEPGKELIKGIVNETV